MKISDFVIEYSKPNYMYKEFLDLKLGIYDLYKHQDFLSRYFANLYVENDEMLFFHEMGTGKTCTSVKICETIFKLYPKEYKGIIVLTKSQGLIFNFIQEIAFKCTDNVYNFTNNYKTKKKIEEKYKFFSFEIFAKMIKDFSNKNILDRFNSHIIIIDEVHNIRAAETKTVLKIYDEIHRFLHILTHRKIILMSGTPMKDNPNEIATVMNLILPLDNQMPINLEFTNTFFKNNEIINEDKLVNFVKKKVSFLKSAITNIPKVFFGSIVAPLTKFKVMPLKMSKIQNRGYELAWKMDQETINIYSNTRQASMFVDFEFNFGKKVKHNFTNLYDNSCKYATLIEHLSRACNKNELSIVYSDIIKGSGLYTLAHCMVKNGYTNSIKNKKSFVILTSNLPEAKKQHYISIFNSKQNIRGDLISVILGSRVIMEGYTFKNVLHEHILTPHWNYSETSQIIARGWRMHSHDELIQIHPNPVLTVYQYASIPTRFPSIDLMMYKTSEQKDLTISKITQIIQKSCFDCYIFKDKNSFGEDFSRECHYSKCAINCLQEPTDGIVYDKNYDIEYFRNSDEWFSSIILLKEIFKIHFALKWCEFYKKFKFGKFKVCQILIYCVENYELFLNKNGNYNHIEYDSVGVYLTPMYSLFQPDYYNHLLCKYEKTNILPEQTYEELVFSNYNFTNIIETLFQVKTYHQCVNILNNLPYFVKEIILQNVLKSKCMKECTTVQKYILDYYKTSIYEDYNYIGYLLRNTWCFDKIDKIQIKDTIIKKYFEEFKQKLETNKLGYYGQENRDLKEFCIKIVSTSIEEDKRKIQSGRRCINWNKKDLIVLGNKIIGNNCWESLSRQQICFKLREYFEKNNLVEHNETCGSQHKRKL